MSHPTPEELRAAAALLRAKGWTKGAEARNAAATPVGVMDPTATCFCIQGAICHAAGGERVWGANNNIFNSAKAAGLIDSIAGSVSTFNDHHCPNKAEAIRVLNVMADHLQANPDAVNFESGF